MLNAFSRDIRSIRAQENIGVHSGAPCSSNIFPKKVILTYGPIVAVGPRANLEAHSWTNERPVALSDGWETSAIPPLSGVQQTSAPICGEAFVKSRKMWNWMMLAPESSRVI
jgi:hypothetical protein